jgi:enolase
VAASSFYKRKKYAYENPMLNRTKEEHFSYLSNLIKNYGLFYIEDGFEEEDFESFATLLKKFPDILIVGDDLTATNLKRFEKAIEMKSINAIIVKPNQNGSLISVKNVCALAKKNSIKIVFSHRSGETEESILADLAFGFGADFFKSGITGKEREAKIKRFIKIEKKL